MDIPQQLQIVSTVVAILGGGATLFSRSPDRRRQRFKDQHQILATLFPAKREPQHDLVVESAFRAAFETSVPATLIRFLVDNRFPLPEIERYCATREYLAWDERTSRFAFRKRRHGRLWVRRAIIGAWLGAYAALALLAAGGLLLGKGNPLGRVVVALPLVVLAFGCVHQASLLSRAAKFIRDQPAHAMPRAPRIAA